LKEGGSVCQTIKRHVYLFALLIIVVASNGCFMHSAIGPGYTVDIMVVDSQAAAFADITHLEEIAIDENFDKRSSSPDKRECLYFGRDLNEAHFGHLAYKFIILGICYDKANLTGTTQSVRNLRVFLNNDWQGQEPTIKQEIDRLGEVFYKELSDRFGKENVRMERRRTGPPF
jgi:hypothetical protein